jgi:hypothetical protein
MFRLCWRLIYSILTCGDAVELSIYRYTASNQSGLFSYNFRILSCEKSATSRMRGVGSLTRRRPAIVLHNTHMSSSVTHSAWIWWYARRFPASLPEPSTPWPIGGIIRVLLLRNATAVHCIQRERERERESTESRVGILHVVDTLYKIFMHSIYTSFVPLSDITLHARTGLDIVAGILPLFVENAFDNKLLPAAEQKRKNFSQWANAPCCR